MESSWHLSTTQDKYLAIDDVDPSQVLAIARPVAAVGTCRSAGQQRGAEGGSRPMFDRPTSFHSSGIATRAYRMEAHRWPPPAPAATHPRDQLDHLPDPASLAGPRVPPQRDRIGQALAASRVARDSQRPSVRAAPVPAVCGGGGGVLGKQPRPASGSRCKCSPAWTPTPREQAPGRCVWVAAGRSV